MSRLQGRLLDSRNVNNFTFCSTLPELHLVARSLGALWRFHQPKIFWVRCKVIQHRLLFSWYYWIGIKVVLQFWEDIICIASSRKLIISSWICIFKAVCCFHQVFFTSLVILASFISTVLPFFSASSTSLFSWLHNFGHNFLMATWMWLSCIPPPELGRTSFPKASPCCQS